MSNSKSAVWYTHVRVAKFKRQSYLFGNTPSFEVTVVQRIVSISESAGSAIEGRIRTRHAY